MMNTLPTQKLHTKLGLVLLALGSVILGSLALTGPAKADPFTMEVTNSRVNISSFFNDVEVLPADVGPPLYLPNLNQISRDDVTGPSGNPDDWPGSFTPLGCGTPVSFGFYPAVDEEGAPITNLTGNPTGHIPLANNGALQEGLVQTGPATLSPAAADIKRYKVQTNAVPNPLGFCSNTASGTIEGEKDEEGNITIDPSDWNLPLMTLPNPLNPSGTPVPFTLNAAGEITGTISESGEMELNGPMEVRVRLLTAPPSAPGQVAALDSYCAIPLSGLNLTTGVSTPARYGFAGDPFAEGIEGPGSLTGTWEVSNPSEANGNTIYPDLQALLSNPGANANRCQSVDVVTSGLGGIWLSAGIAEPKPYPAAKIAVQKFVKNKVAVKAGKKATLKLRITNSGNAQGQATVKVKSSKSKSKGFVLKTKTVSVTLSPGQSVTRNVVVQTNKKAKKRSAKITASLSGKSVNATVQGK